MIKSARLFLGVDISEILQLSHDEKSFTNLKDGNGCPCAGHVKLKDADFSILNAFILSLEENLGSALPTGSMTQK